MLSIFISYSRDDEVFARNLAQSLTDLGADVWLDLESITAGSKWSTAIQEGLDTCSAMLVVLSPSAMASENVEDEWTYFMDLGKPIVPIRWNPCKVHFQLHRLQYIDFHDQPFRSAISQLWRLLHNFPEKLNGRRTTQTLLLEDWGVQTESVPAVIDSDIDLPMLEWVEIPAGAVTVITGGDKTTFNLDPFAISKYPVTVGQYGSFVENGGYRLEEYWTEDGWKWRMQADIAMPHFDKQDKHPVTNVSWFEAVAFSHWLSQKLAEHVTLPSEQQWQRAAQGDDERLYPWGDSFDVNRANVLETEVGKCSSVDAFPQGASPFGVMDMSGNVFEWCLNQWNATRVGSTSLDRNGSRVMRSGSWGYIKERAQCISRSRRDPDKRDPTIGFRLVLTQ